jgi:lysozyme
MPGDRINERQVFECLTYDLAAAESAVSRLVTVELEQHQFDALVSFTYKLGSLAFGNSNLLRAVNANPLSPTIEKQFLRWVYSRGKILPELVRRRKAENWLYFRGELRFDFSGC